MITYTKFILHENCFSCKSCSQLELAKNLSWLLFMLKYIIKVTLLNSLLVLWK